MGYNMYTAFGLPNARDLSTLPVKPKYQAAWRNNIEYQIVFNHLCNLFINMLEWDLPDTCNQRALNTTILFEGRALIFKDKGGFDAATDRSAKVDNGVKLGTGAVLHTPVILDKLLNIYYEFTSRRAYSHNYHYDYTTMDSVLIRANPTMFAPVHLISLYAQKIVDASRTIDVYSNTLKRPWMVNVSRDNDLSYEIVMDKIQTNELCVLYYGDRMAEDALNVVTNPNNGQTLMDLWSHKKNIESEFLTMMGINNNQGSDKRERQVVAEVTANSQYTEINALNLLRWLELACEEAKAILDIDISVRFADGYGIVEPEVNDETDDNTPTAAE